MMGQSIDGFLLYPGKLLFGNVIIKSGLEVRDPNLSVGQSEE